MSFELPRPSRDLRFTGEVRAADLGKARASKQPPALDPYRADPAPTPWIGARPSVRAEVASAAPSARASRETSGRRPRWDSIDDAAETHALDRDVLGLPKTPLVPKAPKHAGLGVPNFRRAAAPPEPQLVWIPAAAKKKPSASRAPGMSLLVWAFLAIVGGSVSYRYAPGVADVVMSAVHTIER